MKLRDTETFPGDEFALVVDPTMRGSMFIGKVTRKPLPPIQHQPPRAVSTGLPTIASVTHSFGPRKVDIMPNIDLAAPARQRHQPGTSGWRP